METQCISQIDKSLSSNLLEDYNCISIYDVFNIIKNKVEKLKEECSKQLTHEKNNSYFNIEEKFEDFDYNKLVTKKIFYNSLMPKQISSISYGIYIEKNDKIYFCWDYVFQNKEVELCKSISEILLEFSKKIKEITFDVKAINHDSTINVLFNQLKINLDNKLILYNDSNNKCYYKKNSSDTYGYELLEGIEILKKIYVKISDCPRCIRKDLYETRKEQLISSAHDLCLNRINKYLNKKHLNKETAKVEVIDLYELSNILNDEFSELNFIYIDNELQKNILKFYKYRDIFSREKPKIIFSYDKKASYIRLIEKNNDELKFSTKKDIKGMFSHQYLDENKALYKFYKENYSLILDNLLNLLKYCDLLGSGPIEELIYKDDTLKIILFISNIGEVNFKIYPSFNNDYMNEEYYKKYNDKESIDDFVNKNLGEILKGIFTNVDNLPLWIQKVIEKNKNKKEKIICKK